MAAFAGSDRLALLAAVGPEVRFPKGHQPRNFRNRTLPPGARKYRISARFIPYVLSS